MRSSRTSIRKRKNGRESERERERERDREREREMYRLASSNPPVTGTHGDVMSVVSTLSLRDTMGQGVERGTGKEGRNDENGKEIKQEMRRREKGVERSSESGEGGLTRRGEGIKEETNSGWGWGENFERLKVKTEERVEEERERARERETVRKKRENTDKRK